MLQSWEGVCFWYSLGWFLLDLQSSSWTNQRKSLFCCWCSLHIGSDEFIIIKHYLVTLPHRKVLKLSEVDKFEFGLSANRRGVVSYTMCVVKKSGYSIPLEMAASNISMSKRYLLSYISLSQWMARENMLKQFNNFLSSAAPAVSYTQETPYWWYTCHVSFGLE